MDAINRVLTSLELDGLEDLYNNLTFTDSSLHDMIVGLISGNANSTFSELFSAIGNNLKRELTAFLPPIVTILVITILLAVVEALKPNRFSESLVLTANFIGNLIIISIVLGMFINLYKGTKDTIFSVVNQIQVLFPIILTLMSVAGGGASVSLYKPSVTLLCNGISLLSYNFLLPLILCMILFCAINCFTQTIKLDKSMDFFKSTFKWVVGITSVIFCFFITTQGIATSIYDGISVKALKYAVGNSIPLINGLVSSGFDVVIASCVLIKNSLGMLSLIIIIYIVIVPVFRLVVFSLLLKFLSAISQSIANDSTIKFISGSADCASSLATVIAIISIVFMITILIIMCALGASF